MSGKKVSIRIGAGASFQESVVTDVQNVIATTNNHTTQLAENIKLMGISSLNRSKFYEKLYTLNKTNGKVVWEGDSITEADDYDEKISPLFPNITHVHGGIGGQTSLDIINRIDTIKANNANLYVIAIGINDARYNDSRGATSKSAYITNMTTIIDSLKLVGDVVIVGIWPHFYPDQYASLGIIGTDKRMDDWNDGLDRLCKQKGIIFINPAPEIRKVITLDAVPTLISDGVHPTTDDCKQLYADAVLFGNVNRQDYYSESVRATGKYLYKLVIYNSNDASYVQLRDLVPNPLPVSGEYYGLTANTGYIANLPQLFNTNADTFAGYANKAGDFPLVITWASNSPLTSLSHVGKTAPRGIKDFILYESTNQESLANPDHSSWKVLKRSLGNTQLQPALVFATSETLSYMSAAPSAVQSIPSTMTKINYGTIKFDESSEYDSVNSRFTAKKRGVYNIQSSISFSNEISNNFVGVEIYKNGGGHTWIYGGNSNSTGARTVIGQSTLLLNAGDYVEIFAWSATQQNTDMNETKNFFKVAGIS